MGTQRRYFPKIHFRYLESAADRAISAGAFGLISLPSFAMAVLLVYVFAIQLGWFPAVGYERLTGPEGLSGNLRSLVLPVAVLVSGLTAGAIKG